MTNVLKYDAFFFEWHLEDNNDIINDINNINSLLTT